MDKTALASRVIVFCGGIGTGKTTCAKILSEFLKENGQPVVCVNPYKDLYFPFAKKQGYSMPIKNTREEMTLLVQNLYQQYGQNLGSKLLIDLIEKKNNAIYILDGKRNPEGIAYLKQALGNRCLIIGVISDLKTRKERIIERARGIDFNNLTQNTSALIKNEELAYGVLKSICLSDFIVCNSGINKTKIKRILKPLGIRFLLSKAEEDGFTKAIWGKLLVIYKNTLPKRFSDLYETTFMRLINIILDNQFNFKLIAVLFNEKMASCHKNSKLQLHKEILFIKFIFKEKIINNIFLLNLIQFYKLHGARVFSGSLGAKSVISNKFHFESMNECEAKFPLTIDIKNKVKEYIAKANILYQSDLILEDDLVIDTDMHDLKKLGILLRFRMFNKGQPPLLTIKFKKERGLIKQDIELQKIVLEKNQIFLNLVNDFLKTLNLSKINFENIIHAKNSDEIVKYFKHTIYKKVRMRIQKKRQIFRIKENETICLDELPKDIGKFIEIESDSLENVERMISLIGLDKNLIIKDDYGELVMLYNKLHNIKDKRVAKFD